MNKVHATINLFFVLAVVSTQASGDQTAKRRTPQKNKTKTSAPSYNYDTLERMYRSLFPKWNAHAMASAKKGDTGMPGLIYSPKVLQVIDEKHMLVSGFDLPVTRVVRGKSYTQVPRFDMVVMIKCNTSGIRDGQVLYPPSVWATTVGSPVLRSVGTTRYNTALGTTKTVTLLEPLGQPEIAKKIAEHKRAALQKFNAAVQKFKKECRVWKDKDGTTLFTAKFISQDKRRYVTFQRAYGEGGDKKFVRVYLYKLSKDDQEWIWDARKKTKKK